MPTDALMKATNALHRATLALTGGKVGWRLKGMPVVQLTTTGRKSGQPRTVMLTSPLQENGTVVVVASRGGDDVAPAWLLNIQADPRVSVSMNGLPATPWTARVATPEERSRMWTDVTRDQPHYGDYQNKTDREIPLVLLEPVA